MANRSDACAPFFDIARENRWHFIITFKEGSIPTLFAEFNALKPRCPDNSARREGESVIQEFSWVNDLGHGGHRLAVLECAEVKKKTSARTRFVWVTDMEAGEHNCRSVAKGGRLRWTIENQGFNTQKNGGYGLEHAFCSDNKGAKNFYLLLQIAHMIKGASGEGLAPAHVRQDLRRHLRPLPLRSSKLSEPA